MANWYRKSNDKVLLVERASLNVDMLMLDSLIDSSTQYFIAESTKTVDLIDNTQHAPGDELWMGCGSVSKAGWLCERTIEVAPTGSDYPCFTVK